MCKQGLRGILVYELRSAYHYLLLFPHKLGQGQTVVLQQLLQHTLLYQVTACKHQQPLLAKKQKNNTFWSWHARTAGTMTTTTTKTLTTTNTTIRTKTAQSNKDSFMALTFLDTGKYFVKEFLLWQLHIVHDACLVKKDPWLFSWQWWMHFKCKIGPRTYSTYWHMSQW